MIHAGPIAAASSPEAAATAKAHRFNPG